MIFNMDIKAFIIISMACSSICAAPSPTFNLQSLAKCNEIFAANLYKQALREWKGQGNVLMSPFSMQIILALLQMAAKGYTLEEMSKAISLPVNKTQVQNAFADLIPVLKARKNATFTSANRIYMREDFDISPKFVGIAIKSFDAGIEKKDFGKKETMIEINKWVESKTNNKIKNFLKEGMLRRDTVMVLLNALYFNAKWAHPFVKTLTLRSNFHVNVSHVERVEMMHGEIMPCRYKEDKDLDAKFVELSYVNNEFSMTFVLPNKPDGLATLERNMDKVLQNKEMTATRARVSIPKFKIENDKIYNPVLQRLGMTSVFTNLADLSDLSISKRRVHVSLVAQKTFIEANEEGTEAGAATAAVVAKFAQFGLPTFIANRPFCFYIRHCATGIITFIGKFVNPKST